MDQMLILFGNKCQIGHSRKNRSRLNISGIYQGGSGVESACLSEAGISGRMLALGGKVGDGDLSVTRDESEYMECDASRSASFGFSSMILGR